MSEIQVSMSKLRQNLGSLVNRAAYGGERVVLVAHGEAKAAIIGIEDLQRLQQLSTVVSTRHLDEITTDLQEQVRELQAAYRLKPEDSAMTLERSETEESAIIERLKLAKLLLDSVLVGPSNEEVDWSRLGLDAFEREWDNPDDAIYDEWRNHYDVSTG